MPKTTRKGESVARHGYRRKAISRNPLFYESGVMIIPPPPEDREQIRADMKRVRQELRDSIGQEAYDKRMQEAKDFFKSITGEEVRS
ncbi:hypothetical protein [Paenibacillus crassostreae]|nr:hypothetical protein [Paenibacillus crassostreae]